MALTIQQSVDTDCTAGAALSMDPSNPTHLLYAGSALVGAGCVVTSVGVTTAVAPGFVLVPGALAAGAAAAGAYLANKRAEDSLQDSEPAAAATA